MFLDRDPIKDVGVTGPQSVNQSAGVEFMRCSAALPGRFLVSVIIEEGAPVCELDENMMLGCNRIASQVAGLLP